MEDLQISVAIPVGPAPHHRRWLGECLDSVFNQTYPADEILIIDDQAHLDRNGELLKIAGREYDYFSSNSSGVHTHLAEDPNLPELNYYKTPWLSGVAHAFNCGVSLAYNEWVVLLGSDDRLYPNALERAAKAIRETNDPLGWFNFACHISSTGQVVNWYNNAGVASKALWRKTGGYHPMTVTGGMDAALHSVLMAHMPEHQHAIEYGTPLYWVRMHDHNYTRESTARYGEFVVQLRNDLTAEWQEPEWTK